MMGPGAGKVETCLEVIREVKGWDLEKEAKSYLAAAKKAAEAEKQAGTAISEAKIASDALEKKNKAVQGRENKLKADKKAFEDEKSAWTRTRTDEEESLNRKKAAFVNTIAAVQERERAVNADMAKAEVKMANAQTLLMRAEDKEKALQPKLDLIAKLRA